MIDFLRRQKEILFLFFITVIIYIVNFTPGTILLGWDSISTEFNPTLGVRRAFFSVWQEYQSLGLVAGMAHAADLVRALFILPLSLALPESAVRYTFHIFVYFLGGVGMLFLLGYILKEKTYRLLPFLGSCFYIFNFFLIQIFFLPFEPFSIMAAVLPWNTLIALIILEEGLTRKNVLVLIVISVLSTPAFVAQQLFIVLNLILGLITLGLFIQQRKRALFKRAAFLFLTIFIVNSFWIFPQMYFLHANGKVTKTSKINQISTEDILFRNKDKGNLYDFSINSGFFSESLGIQNQPLFAGWNLHRNTPTTISILFFFSIVTLIGFFRKSRYTFPFALVYSLVVVALLNNITPIKELNDLIRTNSFINQVFRSPFTKFAIPAAFASTIFFVFGTMILIRTLQKIHIRKEFAEYGITTLFVVLIFIQSFPVFQGQLFSKEMKVSIPQEYTELFTYFKTEPKNKRIALLPEYTHWGWIYSNWGYNGSGFIWYGIEQPIISRNFDMWSSPSESYFWEAKDALEREDIKSYEDVLEKYRVDYLILDESISPVIAPIKAIQYDRLTALLNNSHKITLDKKIGDISIYKVERQNKDKNFLSFKRSLPNIGPEVLVMNRDSAYARHGEYVTTDTLPYDFYYPFLGITSQTRINNGIQIHESEGNWQIIKPNTLRNLSDYNLSSTSGMLEANLYVNKVPVGFIIPYTIISNKKTISVQFPKSLLKEFNVTDTDAEFCRTQNGEISQKKESDVITVFASKNAYACISYPLNTIDQKYGYLVKIGNKNLEGQRLFFSLVDATKSQAYVEDRLDADTEYYILSDRFPEGIGYNFLFQSNSLKRIPSVNSLNHLSIFIIPYRELRDIVLTHKNANREEKSFSEEVNSTKINYYTYDVNNSQSGTLILSQAYDDGWNAYQMNSQNLNFFQRIFPFWFGKKLHQHVLVNNWANGWVLNTISNENNFTIIFLPQYLQYAGFVILLGYTGVLSVLALKSRFRKHSK